MSRASIYIALWLSLFFCACSGPKTTKTESANEKPRVDTVRVCAETIQQYQQGNAPKATTLELCAQMWKQPTCRAAWTADVEDKTSHVMRECAAAYCEDDSTWQLCKIAPGQIDILNDTHDWFALWRNFNHDVLRADLQTEETGVVGDVAVALLLTLSQQKKEPSEVSSTYPKDGFFGLALQKTDDGWEIDAGVHASADPICDTFSVPLNSTTEHYKGLMAFLEKNGPGIGTAFIDPNQPLDDKTRAQLILALRAVGVSVIEVFEDQ